MQKKQLYGTLEISNGEIRLLVGEYFMSRFNVLKIETVKCKEIQNNQILKPEVVTANIIKLQKTVEDALGFKLSSVILCIPSVDVSCIRRKVNIRTEDGSKKILKSQVRAGINTVLENINSDSEFVNVGSIKYIVNGITYRNIPADERCDMYTVVMDLLYANRKTVYSYISCVEKSGLNILDICLDTYAMAEESATIENSMDKYIVLIDFEKEDTILSVYNKGRLQDETTIGYGYGKFATNLHQTYPLTMKESEKIVEESCFDDNGEYDNTISYIWTRHDEYHQISKSDIYNAVKSDVNHWLEEVCEMCDAVKNVGECKAIVCGSGADIVGIKSIISRISIHAELYVPTTIGARNSKYTTMLGSLYVVKKMQELNSQEEVSVNFNSIVASDHNREDESAFTKKLKSILLNK